MTHFGALVEPAKTQEWNTILTRVLNDKYKVNPGCCLSEAYAEAWVQFQQQNWQSAVKDGSGRKKQEYAQMDAGPDLTAISRTRYGAVKKAKKSTSSLLYGYDLSMNPLRLVCVLEMLRRQKKKYKIYYPKNEG